MPRAAEIHGLPSNVEVERLTLGALMIDQAAQDAILATLEDGDFSTEAHRRIYSAARAVRDRGDELDRVTIAHELMARKQVESVGGLGYLSDLDTGLPTLYGLDSYLRILRDQSTLRSAALACHSVAERLCAPGAGLQEIRDAEDILRQLSARGERQLSLMSFAEHMQEPHALDRLLHAEKFGSESIPTPWPSLNEILSNGGFLPGQLVILAARPSVGKSAVAAVLSLHAASFVGVGKFSLEMGRDAIFRRMVAAKAQISLSRLQKGNLSESQRHAVMLAMTEISELPLRVDDTTGATVPAIVAAIRKHNARMQQPIRLVVIDYLQLLTAARKTSNRTEEVSSITRALKLAARELKVPFLVLSQLSRETARSGDKPDLHDLRESGSIEQDADTVLFLYQSKEERAMGFDEQGRGQPAPLWVLVKKQREGRLGDVRLTFFAKYMQITDEGVRSNAD